jgi:hypothetical protein
MLALRDQVRPKSNDMNYLTIVKAVDGFTCQRPSAFARLIWEKACLDDKDTLFGTEPLTAFVERQIL